jgi:DHA1 family tetracycline resistance protein-like MFS transporter
MQFVCAPILGNLSDRFGRRPVLLAAVGTLAIDYMVMAAAPKLGWLFLGRAIAGLAGASFTPAYACVADISPPEKRAQNFSLVSAAFGVGFVLGPALGGLLGTFGPRAPFVAAAALSLLNFTYGWFALPETLPVARRRPFEWKRANPLGTLLQIRKRPQVLGLLVALFLWMLSHQVMPSTWSFQAILRFGWSEAMVGLSLACAGAIMTLSQAVLGQKLIPRLGEVRVIYLGFAIGTLGYVGYALSTQGWMLFAWLPTWLFGALVMPSMNALMSKHVPHDAQGELQGAVASLFSASSIVGPPLMTGIFSRFAAAGARPYLPGAAFLAAASLALLALLVFRYAIRRWHAPR